MHRIDHVCIGVRNLYEGAARLRDETGLDSYDGGWNPSSGVGQRIVPLGRRCYIEVNSVIDHDMAMRHFYGAWYQAVFDDAGRADRFLGWVIAVDTMDELHEIAARIGEPIAAQGKSESGLQVAWKRRLPDGRFHRNENVPDDRHHRWPHGLPMFMHWPDEVNDHPDTIGDVGPVRHRVRPDGIGWVEVGDAATTREWLGPNLADMDVRFVDRPAGLYGVGIASPNGEIVIRREPPPLSLARYYTP